MATVRYGDVVPAVDAASLEEALKKKRADASAETQESSSDSTPSDKKNPDVKKRAS